VNIIFPMAYRTHIDEDKRNSDAVPAPLREIQGISVLERILNSFAALGRAKLIFLVSSQDCRQWNIDSAIKTITMNNCIIIRVEQPTRGSACTALLAVSHINNTDPLIISNSDHILHSSIDHIVSEFNGADAGVLTFRSTHPRWSYTKTDQTSNVIEIAEKNPFSHEAIAGLYYFKAGSYFVEAAMDMIIKDDATNGLYYIAPSLNQLILNNKLVVARPVKPGTYHSLHTEDLLKAYEAHIATTPTPLCTQNEVL